MSGYWLTPAYEEDFDEKVTDINGAYKQAQERAKQGQRTESLDEMTGVQALERKHPGLPMCAGTIERREFEYIRHGTLSFICNFDVVTGELSRARPARPAMKKISSNTSNAVSFQTHWQLNGILSATTLTFTCLNLWCATWQQNPTST